MFVILCHSAQLSHWCQAQSSMKPLSILVLPSNHSSSMCSDAKVEMSSPLCSEGPGCIWFMKSLLTSSWFIFLWRKCRFQAEGFWKHSLVEPGVLLQLWGNLPCTGLWIWAPSCSADLSDCVHSIMDNIILFNLFKYKIINITNM